MVPFVNHKDHIHSCWDHLSLQTFSDFELILIDNGSTDGSDKIARDLALKYPERIRVLSEPKKGIPFARNCGIQHAKGTYISFLDVDDQFTSNKLEVLYQLLQNSPEAAMAFGNTLRIYSETGKEVIQKTGDAINGINFPPNLALLWTWSFYYLPQTGATLVKTDVAKQIGGFPENLLAGNDDVGFHINIALNYPVAYTPFIAVKYYRHTKSEGARLNLKSSVNYRYFDAHYKYTSPAGKEYYNKTGDIRLWGLAQRGLFSNYIKCRFINKITIEDTAKNSFFGFYKAMVLFYEIMPYKIATLNYKLFRKIAYMSNKNKFPIH